jgi:glycosyltransferase involved in cell wall biosynthesis
MLVNGLARAITRAGHSVDIITTPFRFGPAAEILRSMAFWEHENFQRFESGPIDLVIPLKFPTWYLVHPGKVVWLLHQHRAVYELYDTPFGASSGDASDAVLRQSIQEGDVRHLSDAAGIFTISRRVSERLLANNHLSGEPLYHPPPDADAFYCGDVLPYVYFPSRLESLKRQELLIQAMTHVRAPIAAVISGSGGARTMLERLVEKLELQSRVRLIGQVAASEMAAWYANSLAVFFGPLDEDYGYVTLEAMLSSKPVITCTDSGGPLEFVLDGQTGLVVNPTPQAVADAIDTLWAYTNRAAEMGRAGRERYHSLGISWERVVDVLLNPGRHDQAIPGGGYLSSAEPGNGRPS